MDKLKSSSDIAMGLGDLPVDPLVRKYQEPAALKAMREFQEPAALKAIREFQEPAAVKAIREFQEPAAVKAIREFQEPAAVKAIREAQEVALLKATGKLEESPMAKAIRELQDSPALKAIREIQDSPFLRALRGLEESPILTAMREFEESPALKAIRELQDSPFLRGMRGVEESPFSKAIREFQESPTLKAIARASQWASQIAGAGGLAAQLPTWAPIAEIEQIQRAATGVLSLSAEVGRLRLSAVLGVETLSAGLQTTRLKLSALAGAGDVFGFEARSSFTAYEQLFGNWHTRPDLPNRFWRDSEMRQQRYREAEVDPGLIETTPAAAIDVVIESGFAAGVSAAGGSVALINVAGLSMQIRSGNPRDDAFSVIGFFEHALRLFISKKLAAVAGPKWFKQRVDGHIHKKACDLRASAMANGEQDKALLSHLDLGDLLAILLRKDNWDGAFGYIFPNRERLQFDLQALIATRRPTMHSRDVDAVRLVELICIIRRLSQFMTGDGEWKRIADSED